MWLLAAAAPFASASRLPIRVYRTAQGLPRNTVGCMVAAPNGAMWFCSTEGLVRFDGRNFRVFGPEHGLPSRAVVAMYAIRRGGYWVITDRGPCRIAAGARVGDSCRMVAGAEREDWRFGAHVLETSSGETWIASTRRVFRLDPARFAVEDVGFAAAASFSVLSLAEGDGDTLLMGTEDGLFEWKRNGEIRHLTAGMSNIGVGNIVRHPSGDYWLATASGLFRLRLRGAARTPELRGGWVPYPEYPRQLLLRRDGRLWAVGLASVLQLALDPAGDARVARRITAADGLPTANLANLSEDSSGGLWVSSEGDGVARIDDSGFLLYTGADGLSNARIASLFEDLAGHLNVMITWDGRHSLFTWAGGRFHPVQGPYPLDLHHSSGLNQVGLQARNGEWWFATDTGVMRFGAATIDTLSTAPLLGWYRTGHGLECAYAVRVFEDSPGNIWVSCGELPAHPARFDRASGRFQSTGPADGWPARTAAQVFRELAPGVLWIGTSDGAVRYRGGRIEVLMLSETTAKEAVRDVLIDRALRVWLATSGGGLYRCDQPEAERPVFVHYGLREGLSSLYLRALAVDGEGYVYASSVRGVDRIDPNAPVASRRVRHFDEDDGLPDAEQNVALTARNGRLWFGSMRGLAEFQPGAARAQCAPEVYFTRVLVRGDEVPLAWDGARSAALSLSADRNQVQVEFAGGDLRPAADLRFQYRLVGVGEEWSEPSGDLRVNYPALPAGRLRFEVRAVNAEGQVSRQPAVLDLDVAGPVWRRWWFLALAAVVCGALVTGVYRYRVSQLLQLERLRTRIATDLHDDIGANLSQIAILTELARRDPARGSLEVVSAIARETVEQMSDIVWAVNPRHDRFEAMLHRMRRYAEETLGGVNIELGFERGGLAADFSIPIEARRPLYLVFKEAITNAARHSGASLVTVRFELGRGSLHMTITDDGRGFDLQAPRDGEGVSSIGNRVRGLGGTVAWDSAPGRGTRLEVALPLKRGRSHLD